jgi:hypothetical protein
VACTLSSEPGRICSHWRHLAAAMQADNQLDVFVVRDDGAIWVTWERNDKKWTDGIDGRDPKRITPTEMFPPGAPLVAIKQRPDKLNVFAVHKQDRAIWMTWERGNSEWHAPVRVSPVEFAPIGAHLAAAMQADNQLDVFVVRDDGAIWVTWERNDKKWTDGIDGRDPKRITPTEMFPPGAPLVAIKQRPDQLNVFAVHKDDRAIWTTRQFLMVPSCSRYSKGIRQTWSAPCGHQAGRRPTQCVRRSRRSDSFVS